MNHPETQSTDHKSITSPDEIAKVLLRAYEAKSESIISGNYPELPLHANFESYANGLVTLSTCVERLIDAEDGIAIKVHFSYEGSTHVFDAAIASVVQTDELTPRFLVSMRVPRSISVDLSGRIRRAVVPKDKRVQVSVSTAFGSSKALLRDLAQRGAALEFESEVHLALATGDHVGLEIELECSRKFLQAQVRWIRLPRIGVQFEDEQGDYDDVEEFLSSVLHWIESLSADSEAA